MITNITPRESALAAIATDYRHEALAWSITAENLEQAKTNLYDRITPTAFIAWRNEGPVFDEDCVCQDPVWPADEDDDRTSMALYTDDQAHGIYAPIITRLRGEATVMVGLLTEAVTVLQTVEPECATENESLTRLRGDIWAVLTAVAKRGGV